MASSVRSLPRRDFIAIVFSLGGITALSWYYLYSMAKNMSIPNSMVMLQIPVWDTAYWVMMISMWIIMMIGMMIPTALPTVLIYAAVVRKASREGMSVAPTTAFVSGYVVVWTVFSLLATVLQWGLDKAALLSPMMISESTALGASLLIAAGIYQWLPIKDRCLRYCRSPMNFISEHWRAGVTGAFQMGLLNGLHRSNST